MQLRSEATRIDILNAARALFAQCGYEGAGVAEICRSAGVSKGAFYHHFPSKQALFLALLEEWLDQLEPLLKQFASQTENASDALVQMSAVLPLIFASGRGQLPLFLEFWVQSSRDPKVWEVTIAPYHRFHALFERLMAVGVDQGALRQMDPASASRVLMALAIGLIIQGLFDPHSADWVQVSREGIQFLVDGMSRRAA